MVVKLQHQSIDVRIGPLDGRRFWARLLHDVWVGIDGHGYIGVSGSGGEPFEYDGASLPPSLWGVMAAPTEWPWLYAGALHDAGYEGRLVRRFDNGGTAAPVWLHPAFNHALFREVLIAGGVPVSRAWAAWTAVRGYGLAWGESHNYLPLDVWRRINPTGSVIAS
jgi:hypothetical protein